MNTTHSRRPTLRAKTPNLAMCAWIAAVLSAGVVGACDGVQAEPAASGDLANVVPATAPPTPPEPDAAVQGERVQGPPSGLIPPAEGRRQLVGVIEERLPAGGYLYLRLQPEDGASQWVVTLGGSAGVGSRVEVDNLGSRRDFHSRRLGRRFDDLVFGVVRVVG
ncbi:MAG: hypothetical protein K0V04_18010 [Deltaproteobacteria bacterium]|nr:hypothetical protein [Deltaproteobacteria bacterium]